MSDMPNRRSQISYLAYWVALAALFAWGAWVRIQAPLDPIADPDVWGYLSPAVSKLIGSGFSHSGRNFVYPGFLYLLLRVAGDFRAIVLVQHALGLLAGGVMVLIWQRARDLIRGPQLPAGVHRWFGLLPVGIYLFAADTIRFELQIRPESICGFLGILNIYLVLQFMYWFFVRQNKRAAVLYGIGAFLSVLLFGSARPSFWLAALGSLLPVCFIFLHRGWFREKLAILLGAVAGLALLILPERLLAYRDDVARAYVPTLLFVGHADIIRDQMATDLADSARLPYGREWLGRIHAVLSNEIQKSFEANPGHYPSLGFDPEYLIYQEDSIDAELRREFRNDIEKLCTFYRFYYGRSLLKQPMRVLAKIGRQMLLFYVPRCGAYNSAKHLFLSADYDASASEMNTALVRPLFSEYKPAIDFSHRSEAIAREQKQLEQHAYIRRPLLALAQSYSAFLIAALLLSAIVLSRISLRRQLGGLAVLVLLSYWYNFATCFETAALNSLEVYRYMTVQLIFTILAQFLTLLLGFELLLAMWGCRRRDSVNGLN
jgi:hypothetical protein